MARFCQKCGAEVPEGSPVCRSCFEPVKPEGWFARLRRLFGGRRSSLAPATSQARATRKFTTSEVIRISDPLTGDMHEYHSLDEVPELVRDQIRKLYEARTGPPDPNVITVLDTDGTVQTYRSVDELPPDLRKLYKQTHGGG